MLEIKGIVPWLKNWFYEKSEVYKKEETMSSSQINTALSSKLNSNLTTANKALVTDGSGDVILEDKVNITGKADKTNGASQITDSNAGNYSNIDGSLSSSSTQAQINAKINERFGDLDIDLIEITSNKGEASESKMGKFFIEVGQSKTDIYYVKSTTSGNTTTYSWQKLEEHFLEDVNLDWSNITNNPFSSSTPSSFAPTNHASANNTYGLGTGSNYGHVKVINNVAQNTHQDGTALSAYMGKLLNSYINELYEITDQLKVFYVDALPNNYVDVDQDGLYVLTSSTGISINKWEEPTSGNMGDYGQFGELCFIPYNHVTSYSLEPKGSNDQADAWNGVIKIYFGDEPT